MDTDRLNRMLAMAKPLAGTDEIAEHKGTLCAGICDVAIFRTKEGGYRYAAKKNERIYNKSDD